MPELKKIYLYRMIHIENIPHILQNGLTHESSPNANKKYVPIGDGSLITTRRNRTISNGKILGDYIPFYFGLRTPMLYVVQHGYNLVKPTPPGKIIYCITSVQKIIDQKNDFIFTDGHAVDSFSDYYFKTDINNIDEIVDFNAVKAKYWNSDNDLDLKRRKEAEFLVLGDISPQALIGFYVYNEEAQNKLLSLGIPDDKVLIRSNFYF